MGHKEIKTRVSKKRKCPRNFYVSIRDTRYGLHGTAPTWWSPMRRICRVSRNRVTN